MAPVRTLRAGESIEFRVVAAVERPGELVARAEVVSVRTPGGVAREDFATAVQ